MLAEIRIKILDHRTIACRCYIPNLLEQASGFLKSLNSPNANVGCSSNGIEITEAGPYLDNISEGQKNL